MTVNTASIGVQPLGEAIGNPAPAGAKAEGIHPGGRVGVIAPPGSWRCGAPRLRRDITSVQTRTT